MGPDEYRYLEFENGTVAVPAGDYPWITEWDWDLDEESGQVVRLNGGIRIVLFHEILKKHRNDEEDRQFILSPEQLDAVFAGDEAYLRLLSDWSDRNQIGADQHVVLPNPSVVVGACLTQLIYFYYDWLYKGLVFKFQSDEDPMVPGSIHGRRRRKPCAHRRMAEFLEELTGDWDQSDDSPTGMVPMRFFDVAAYAIADVLGEILESENEGRQAPELWQVFEEAGKSLEVLVLDIRDLLRVYPLPVEPTL